MPRDTLPFYDVLLGLMGAACWMYIVVNFDSIARRAGMFAPFDITVAVIGILILFESCRRIVGLPIMIIAGIFIAYSYFRAYFTGFLKHLG